MDAIELTVNRQKRYVAVDKIRYIKISDKLCNIYLKNQPTIQIFISIAEIEKMLPKEEFARISRNIIVAFSSIQSIRDTIRLYNQEELTYSMRRKKELLMGYQEYIERVLIAGKVNDYQEIESNRFKRDYRCFDKMPIPFAIIEIVVNADRKSTDFIFRYANQALAVLENTTLDAIINHSFYNELFEETDENWLELYTEVAFHGGYKEVVQYSIEVDKILRVQCFQPYYGYCGCMLTDVTASYNNRNKGEKTENEGS